METRASYVIVGAFVTSFFIAVVLAVVWLADLDIDAETTLYDVYFTGSVSGLAIGNPVRYEGVPIGQVQDILISRERFGQVRVVIEVPEDTPIREDAVARLEYQGITGVGFIQIDPGTEAAAPIAVKAGQERPEIRSEKSALQQVFESAPDILADLEVLASQAAKLFNDETIANLQGTMQNINAFSGALSDSSEDVADILRDGAETLEQVRLTATQAERLVSAFADRADGLAVASEDTILEAKALVQDMRGFTAQLDGLAGEISPVIANADRTITRFADLGDRLGGEVGALSEQLSGTIDTLEQSIIGTEARIATLTEDTGVTLGTVRETLTLTQTRIDSVAATAEDTMGRYASLADTIAPMVADVSRDASAAVADLSEISGDLRTAATSIAGAADEARLLISENREPVTNFSNTGLYEFTLLLSEMRILVNSLTRITSQIERDPAQFFFGDSQQGFEAE